MRPGSPRQGSGSVRGSERIHSGGRRGPDRRLADSLAAGRRAQLGVGDRGRRDRRPEQCQEPVEEGAGLLLTVRAATDDGAAVDGEAGLTLPRRFARKAGRSRCGGAGVLGASRIDGLFGTCCIGGLPGACLASGARSATPGATVTGDAATRAVTAGALAPVGCRTTAGTAALGRFAT